MGGDLSRLFLPVSWTKWTVLLLCYLDLKFCMLMIGSLPTMQILLPYSPMTSWTLKNLFLSNQNFQCLHVLVECTLPPQHHHLWNRLFYFKDDILYFQLDSLS